MKVGILCLFFALAFANQIEEKSITTCLLCQNLVSSSIDTIESTLESFVVGIVEGWINGLIENSSVIISFQFLKTKEIDNYLDTFQIENTLNSACEKYCSGTYEALLPLCKEYVANFTMEIPIVVHEQIPPLIHDAISGQLNADEICNTLAACP